MRALLFTVLLVLAGCAHPRPQTEPPTDSLDQLTSMMPKGDPPPPAPAPPPPPPPAVEPAPAPPPPEEPVGPEAPEPPTVGRPVRSQMTAAAPPVCVLPPLPEKATRWVGRWLSTGTMPGPSSLETFVLDVVDQRATWTEFAQRAEKPRPLGDALPAGEWTCAESAAIEATVERQTTRELVLGFIVGEERYSLKCTKRKLQVAPQDALREPLRQLTEECKRSRWATAAREPVEALVCVNSGVGGVTILARPPGVEFVGIDEDDCGDPTLALRKLPADGVVRTVRRLPPKR